MIGDDKSIVRSLKCNRNIGIEVTISTKTRALMGPGLAGKTAGNWRGVKKEAFYTKSFE
jgi:hypothetical protein